MQRNSEVLERLSLEDLIPQVYEYSNGEVVLHTMSDNACREFVAPEDSVDRGISSIFSLDLASSSFDYEVDHIGHLHKSTLQPMSWCWQNLPSLAGGSGATTTWTR